MALFNFCGKSSTSTINNNRYYCRNGDSGRFTKSVLFNKTSKKRNIYKKIEEFHSLIIEYEIAGNRLIHSYYAHRYEHEGIMQYGETIDNAIVKMQMIIELYFPSVNFEENEYRSLFDSLHTLNYKKAGDKVKSNARSLKGKSKTLMRRHKH
ncbi:hypothetical protein P4S65_11565 [Pseudoalteromonas sp. B131b]|uniref:hypothetical protein n=1 Tax=Pseudoalteromonas sp. B131b TaxID=630493 RepID=UPI00301C9B7F